MSTLRRPLLTATAAGTLLAALWFVPSANATDEQPSASAQASAARERPEPGDGELRLADTGGPVDTTPYLIGGTAFLCAGAGFVAYSARRAGRSTL
ncbi:hypothetical protein ABT160_24005 [Streptomyces sp. NPDC001941]|uniref:hypothetical protein n=1 Tax=Streptomyces sp. NPDC001941 TaxID=3154659 RepID=UPI00332E2AB3